MGFNPENKGLKTAVRQARAIDDGLLRLIGIPGFGLSIPHFTGLFGPLGPQDAAFWLGHVYFVMLATVIWQGNRWLLFKQREHTNWFANPVRKLLLLVAANIFYTAPVTVAMLWGWYLLAGVPIDWPVIRVVALVNVICVLFVTHVYETAFLIKERQGDLVAVAQLERAKAQAELEALKNQIDPHFMFNSLNTLSFLIENDQERALIFNDKLADVYRYILTNKDKALIPLKEEMEFLNNYFTLLKVRFGGSVDFRLRESVPVEQQLIPPISLQVLMENAVKHNEFDHAQPLFMIVAIGEERVRFSNPLRPRASRRPSAGIGLHNLNERSRLVTGREIRVFANQQRFAVEVPLVKTVV